MIKEKKEKKDKKCFINKKSNINKIIYLIS